MLALRTMEGLALSAAVGSSELLEVYQHLRGGFDVNEGVVGVSLTPSPNL